MDLKGRHGSFRFTLVGWGEVLQWAVEHGWKPEGTRPGQSDVRRCRYAARRAGKSAVQVRRAVKRLNDQYHGSYEMNEQQAVGARDAKSLAKAIERGLLALRDDDGLLQYVHPDTLRAFIRYCRKGRFEIW